MHNKIIIITRKLLLMNNKILIIRVQEQELIEKGHLLTGVSCNWG